MTRKLGQPRGRASLAPAALADNRAAHTGKHEKEQERMAVFSRGMAFPAEQQG